MEPALAVSDERETGGLTGAERPGKSGTEMRDEECLRMAAFRLGETAKRIATLAARAHDPALRANLLAVREQLLKYEEELLALTH